MRENSNPWYQLGMPVFKTGTLNYSDTHPFAQVGVYNVIESKKKGTNTVANILS